MSVFDRLPQDLPMLPASSEHLGVAFTLSGAGGRVLAVVLETAQTLAINRAALLWKDVAARLIGDPNGAVIVQGPGRIGLSLDLAGRAFAVPLHRHEAIEVQSGRFLCAIGAERRVVQMRGLADRLTGGSGATLDSFRAGPEGAVVWVQSAGEVLERRLGEGESLDIRPDALLCKDDSVTLAAALAGESGVSWPCLRLTGPGRVALQTAAPMPHIEPEAQPARSSGLRLPFGTKR